MTEIVSSPITMRGAQFYFRNFAGKKGDYNPEGYRNFGVFLEPDLAEVLNRDGWNVKMTKPKPGADPRPFLKVVVSYKKRPPIVVVKTGKKTTKLDESDIKMLDWAEVKNVDLIINPYNWEVNGKTGVKAYLKAIYVTIVEDEFAAEYRDVPDSEPLDDDDA